MMVKTRKPSRRYMRDLQHEFLIYNKKRGSLVVLPCSKEDGGDDADAE
jgi:hypothetical protein